MKTKQILLASTMMFAGAIPLSAQKLGDRILENTKRTLENRVEQKVDKTVNKGVDKVEEKVDDAAKKDTDNDKGSTNSNSNSSDNNPNSEGNSSAPSAEKPTLKTYGKFDFVPGEKIVAIEDFMQDAVGDYPAKWNTNGSGEIVTIDGQTDHFLKVSKSCSFYPEFITDLPENFTLEYDLICNEKFNFYSSALTMNFVKMNNAATDFINWGPYKHGEEGVSVSLHPTGAGNGGGTSHLITYSGNNQIIKNELTTPQFDANHGRNRVRISVWRQKGRLRVYMNQDKIWDIPRAFQEGVKYNGLVFFLNGMHVEEDNFLISNLRLAVGAPDTRSKLITEGKLVTRGIQFESGSDKVKAESYGTLKEIAGVLKENPTVRVKIIGHTDSDGDDASNLDLSKRRAAAVKEALIKEFGIETTRMETDGKGESQPADVNTTSAGKANNRRVEFVKL